MRLRLAFLSAVLLSVVAAAATANEYEITDFHLEVAEYCNYNNRKADGGAYGELASLEFNRHYGMCEMAFNVDVRIFDENNFCESLSQFNGMSKGASSEDDYMKKRKVVCLLYQTVACSQKMFYVKGRCYRSVHYDKSAESCKNHGLDLAQVFSKELGPFIADIMEKENNAVKSEKQSPFSFYFRYVENFDSDSLVDYQKVFEFGSEGKAWVPRRVSTVLPRGTEKLKITIHEDTARRMAIVGRTFQALGLNRGEIIWLNDEPTNQRVQFNNKRVLELCSHKGFKLTKTLVIEECMTRGWHMGMPSYYDEHREVCVMATSQRHAFSRQGHRQARRACSGLFNHPYIQALPFFPKSYVDQPAKGSPEHPLSVKEVKDNFKKLNPTHMDPSLRLLDFVVIDPLLINQVDEMKGIYSHKAFSFGVHPFTSLVNNFDDDVGARQKTCQPRKVREYKYKQTDADEVTLRIHFDKDLVRLRSKKTFQWAHGTQFKKTFLYSFYLRYSRNMNIPFQTTMVPDKTLLFPKDNGKDKIEKGYPIMSYREFIPFQHATEEEVPETVKETVCADARLGATALMHASHPEQKRAIQVPDFAQGQTICLVPAENCPRGWQAFNGRCFKMIAKASAVPYEAGKKECEEQYRDPKKQLLSVKFLKADGKSDEKKIVSEMGYTVRSPIEDEDFFFSDILSELTYNKVPPGGGDDGSEVLKGGIKMFTAKMSANGFFRAVGADAVNSQPVQPNKDNCVTFRQNMLYPHDRLHQEATMQTAPLAKDRNTVLIKDDKNGRRGITTAMRPTSHFEFACNTGFKRFICMIDMRQIVSDHQPSTKPS